MNLKYLQDEPPWDWPEGAGKFLKKILTDNRASAGDRLIAAGLAGDMVVINDDLAQVLLAIIGSAQEPDELRGKAAISLGPVLDQAFADDFEDPEFIPITERTFHKIQESLRKLYLDASIPKIVRRRILEASVRAPEEWHKEAIGAAYSSGDRDMIITAVFDRFVD